MHVVYSNTFGGPRADVLVTGEASVAGTRTGSIIADDCYDRRLTRELNRRLSEFAYTWAGPHAEVEGVSAADLAGTEALHSILMPVVRGVLDSAVVRAQRPAAVTVVRPRTGHALHDAYEGRVCDAVLRALGLPADDVSVSDDRDDVLVRKYAMTRSVEWLRTASLKRAVPAGMLRLVLNSGGLLRSRSSRLALVDYYPTTAFARSANDTFRLARFGYPPSEVPRMFRRGDVALPSPQSWTALRMDERTRENLLAVDASFDLDGVELWPFVREPLVDLASRYAAWVRRYAPRLRRFMSLAGVDAVLVPFDGPPHARLILRVAQGLGIPTLLINDGWKGDDHQQEGMTADRVLAWSEGMARDYLRRRPPELRPTVVTGNPKMDELPSPVRRHVVPAAPRRILVGSFTYSPIDLDCRRSDPERFLWEVLEGIADLPGGPSVTVKLHPADDPRVHEAALGHVPELDVDVVSSGRVEEYFADHDVYVTTYSTSLLEAVATGMPIVYYRVNSQRLYAPFSADDPIVGPRTASSPAELAELLGRLPDLAPPPAEELEPWLVHHLGPRDGRAAERMARAIREDMKLPRGSAAPR